jgi:N-acetylglucosaminyl-diphospho-decaprenol L-rhamnosyltransferase
VSPGGAAPRDRIAVAVVSWNTRGLLRACLESLRPDADAGRAEVWVVDNASSDGSADMVRSDFGWTSLLALDENVGFGAAVNRVAAQTDAPWIAPANADVEVELEALGTLVQAGARDPGAGAVAPRLILPDGSTQHSVYRFPTVPFTAAFNGGLYRVSRRAREAMLLEGMWDAARPRVVDWAIAALIVVRRTAWDAAGGFDEGQWMYAEDLDLGWRLAEAGWTTFYEPAARVHHAVSAATEAAFGDEKTARWIEASYETIARRRGLTRASAVGALNAAGSAVRWLALAPLQAVAPKRYREQRERARWWAGLHVHGLRSAWGSRRR